MATTFERGNATPLTQIIYQDNIYQLFDCCCVSKVIIVGKDKQYIFYPHSLDCKVLQFVQEESIKMNHPIIIMRGNR